MTQLIILGSSSSGNCALLSTPHSTVLIDVGFTGKQIESLLEQQSYSIKEVDAVFLTHEHQDHTAGLTGLSRYSHLTFFANIPTAEALTSKLKRPPKWNYFESGSTFQYRDLQIDTFSIPHDAYDPVGFIFHILKDYENCDDTPSSKNTKAVSTSLEQLDLFTSPSTNSFSSNTKTSVGFITDLGYVPPGILERMKQLHYLILEANYDDELLESDVRRPWSLKQRIRGRHGHLSNTAAIETLKSLQDTCIQQVILGHLSKDCNDVLKLQKLLNTSADFPFPVHILNPHNPCHILALEKSSPVNLDNLNFASSRPNALQEIPKLEVSEILFDPQSNPF